MNPLYLLLVTAVLGLLMLPMLRVPLETKVWTPRDTKKVVRLEGGIILRSLVVEHTAEIDWDAGDVTPYEDAFAGAFNLNLFLADSNPIFSARYDVWKHFHEAISQVVDDYDEVTGSGTDIVSFRTVIPFADPNLPKPDDTAYDMALAKSPRLEITFDGLAAMTPDALGTSAVVSQETNVTMVGVQRPAGAPAVQTTMLRRFKQYATQGASDLPAGSRDKTLKLDVGSTVRRVFITSRGALETTRAKSSDLLTTLEWYINGNKYGAIPFLQQQAIQRQEKHVIPQVGTVLQDFDVSGDIDPMEMLSLIGVDGTAGINVGTAAAYTSGIEVAYMDETILFPPAVAG